VIVCGRHLPGIAFGSIDNSPVKLFFLVVAPTVSQHLQISARLTRLLNDPRLRQALLNAAQPEDVLDSIRQAEQRGEP